MKFGVLHISDIHLRTNVKSNSVLDKIDSVGRAIKTELYGISKLIILVSGDTAFSGKEAEYEYGITLLDGIKESITRHLKMDILIVTIPGNHDCDFGINKSVRDDLMFAVRNRHDFKLSEDKINQIAKPQEHYFFFEDIYEERECLTYKDRLFKQYEFSIGDFKVIFNCLNTAWISELHEQPGKMIYPLDNYKDLLNKGKGGLVFTALHHPLHWLDPMNNRLNKDIIEEYSDLVLTGHEHVPTFKQTTDLERNYTGYIEGGALQTNNPEESEFNLLLINLFDRKQKVIKYKWDSEKYSSDRVLNWADLRIGRPSSEIIQVNEDFNTFLNDVGITLNHPKKSKVELDEIYVFPDAKILKLEQSSNEEVEMYINLNELKEIKEENKFLITGVEQIGKSTFCKVIFRHYLSQGYIPVLIDGRKLNNSSIEEFNKVVYKSFSNQYSEEQLEEYKQLSDDKKLIIIDDFDKSKLNSRFSLILLSNINKYYKNLIVTGNELLKFQDFLFSDEIDEDFGEVNFQKYEIMPFGHRLRGQLINKWNKIGETEWTEDAELISKNATFENTINTIIGNNFVPSVPFFIMVMLQTLESGTSHNLSESTYGYYYEHLIRQAFIKINIKNEEIDAFYNFITELSFVFFEDQAIEKTRQELNEFHVWYNREYHLSLDISNNLSKLVDASILNNVQDIYKFKYKYTYYYFVARYLSINITESSIRQKISEMCSKLYLEEYANIIMFLTHLSKDPFVLDEILKNSKKIFEEYKPAKLEEDVINLNKLIVEIPKIIIEDKDVEQNREEHLYARDQFERSKKEVAINQVEDGDPMAMQELDIIGKLNLSFKTLEILGQILKNYYGSIKGSQKLILGEEAYNLGLRSLGSFLTMINEHSESIVKEIEKILSEKKITSKEEISKIASKFVFNLCCAISYHFIKKISTSVGSKKLTETFNRILQENNTIAVNLIDLSIKFDHIHNIPFAQIEEIKDGLRQNNLIGYSLLRGLVVNYLYMFKTNFRDKQKICSLLDISIESQTKRKLLVASRDK
jgi:hypothetical protein